MFYLVCLYISTFDLTAGGSLILRHREKQQRLRYSKATLVWVNHPFQNVAKFYGKGESPNGTIQSCNTRLCFNTFFTMWQNSIGIWETSNGTSLYLNTVFKVWQNYRVDRDIQWYNTLWYRRGIQWYKLICVLPNIYMYVS